MSTSKEVRDGYISTLNDLTCNSKPLINVLTILADENVEHAADIVATIESHLQKVRKDVKLPVLYLIDCIMKNVGGTYLTLFGQNIIPTFCHVFEAVDEKVRAEMWKLRQTWNDVLPKSKLYSLDMKVNQMDPAWPVVAPPITNNIHLNPKFLQNTAIPKKSPPIETPPPDSGLTTLDMQKKLLMKQQQLLELQQKRLELEVLQTQVKLQERMSVGNGTTAPTQIPDIKPSNILLKPEVAKQLAGNTNAKSAKSLNSSSAMLSKRPQTGHTGLGNVTAGAPPRIPPVNSALVAAVSGARAATRDPRLARHQPAAAAVVNANTTVSSNVQIENKSNITTETLGSNANNKSFNNTKPTSRTDPRSQVTPKAGGAPDGKKPKPTTTTMIQSQSPNKNPSPPTKRTSSKSSSSSSKGSSSTSSLDSPTKPKGGSSKASLSPSKHKKKDRKIPSLTKGAATAAVAAAASVSSAPSSVGGSGKADKEGDKVTVAEPPSPGKMVPSASFKEFKGSKSRNYVRRNREPSRSPENARDVDLRLGGPPEKQPRLLQADSKDEKGTAFDLPVVGMDVDLRHLPAVVTKKRPSTESPEPVVAPKKSKTEVFDELFGNEDTDLRQLTSTVINAPPTQDRPPTPPPPIISSKTEDEKKSEKVKNLDLLRAKLANATNKEKFRSKLVTEQKHQLSSDTDLRSNSTLEDSINRIIISSADEQCIRTGNMTREQEKALMNKILAQMENQKLNEAKRKDSEQNDNNITVPDDDPVATSDGSSDEETAAFRRHVYADHENNKDRGGVEKDSERRSGFVNKFPGRRGGVGIWGGRVPRGGRGMLRGMGGRLRPPANGPWKPMPPFGKPISGFGNEVIDLDEPIPVAPEVIPQELVVDCSLNQDNTKSISIDGCPRDIRYYDETAIVFMSWDDPREISFQNGSRKVIFGDKDVYVLNFNEPYAEVLINGSPHNVKLGAPTREIYVDGKFYECFFGGPPILIDLDGTITSLKMDGPPPQVKIGTKTRFDLVAGQINLVIDAKTVVPVFLDAKTQKFDIDGKMHTLRFIDSLKTVLINENPFNVEYGGLPKPIIVQDKKHFIRFTRLPKGVLPGMVRVKDMEGLVPDSPRYDNENSLDAFPVLDTNEPALPVKSKRWKNFEVNSPDRNSNSPIPNIFQQSGLNNLDTMLSSVIASNLLPLNPNANNGYQVESLQMPPETQQPPIAAVPEAPQLPQVPVPPQAPPTVLPTTFNINELFQKLVSTGIMTTLQEQKPIAVPPPPAVVAVQEPTVQPPPMVNKNVVGINPNVIPMGNNNANVGFNLPSAGPKFPTVFPRKEAAFYRTVTFDKPETLKMRQSTLIHSLYSGMPCSSCGMRFPPEQSMQYSQHLDWHFRQNRKGKRNIRKAASRRWYYSLGDWKNYEEIEDLEEREKSYFESQQQQQQLQQSQGDGGPDDLDEEAEAPSVPADPNVQDPRCEVCRDRFDQFYNEEKEEWHLKQAVCVEGANYHPLCYKDYQASLTLEESVLENHDEASRDSVIPGLDAVIDDDGKANEAKSSPPSEIVIDDDDSEKLSTPAESDSKDVVPEKPVDLNELMGKDGEEDEKEDDGDDDDVIINEVVPEKIDLVDDDKYDDVPETKEPERRVIQIKEEPIDDGFVDVEGGIFKVQDIANIKIKSEPIDPDELDEASAARPDDQGDASSDAHSAMDPVAQMDGNVQFEETTKGGAPAAAPGRIKINITKPLPVIVVAPKESNCANKELSSETERQASDSLDLSQPLPPGEEPVQLHVKPALRGLCLRKLPPVKKGSELSGLCSIM